MKITNKVHGTSLSLFDLLTKSTDAGSNRYEVRRIQAIIFRDAHHKNTYIVPMDLTIFSLGPHSNCNNGPSSAGRLAPRPDDGGNHHGNHRTTAYDTQILLPAVASPHGMSYCPELNATDYQRAGTTVATLRNRHPLRHGPELGARLNPGTPACHPC